MLLQRPGTKKFDATRPRGGRTIAARVAPADTGHGQGRRRRVTMDRARYVTGKGPRSGPCESRILASGAVRTIPLGRRVHDWGDALRSKRREARGTCTSNTSAEKCSTMSWSRQTWGPGCWPRISPIPRPAGTRHLPLGISIQGKAACARRDIRACPRARTGRDRLRLEAQEIEMVEAGADTRLQVALEATTTFCNQLFQKARRARRGDRIGAPVKPRGLRRPCSTTTSRDLE